jgi:hypothetical protein
MFPEGRQLPLLQTLRLEVERIKPDGFYSDWCVDASDISRLASALPALNRLSLCHVLKDTPEAGAVVELAQTMTGIKQLWVAGDAFDDRATGFVAQMTQLADMGWHESDMTSVGLQKLTALTNLGSLIMHNLLYMDKRLLTDARDGGCLELFTSPEVRTCQCNAG